MLLEDIIRRIKIGTAKEAEGYARFFKEWVVINVAEPDEVIDATINIPLLSKKDWLNWDKPTAISLIRLNAIASIIHEIIRDTDKYIFINCTVGEERSPLVLTWYFHQYHNLSLENAFDIVKKIRPEAQNRISWITYDTYEEWKEHNRK